MNTEKKVIGYKLILKNRNDDPIMLTIDGGEGLKEHLLSTTKIIRFVPVKDRLIATSSIDQIIPIRR